MELHQDIYWLKGANGSGKTTFFKMLAGLIPFEGNIRLAGLNLRQQPIAYRQCVSKTLKVSETAVSAVLNKILKNHSKPYLCK